MTTARNHFDEDIARAAALVTRAQLMAGANEPDRLVGDLRLSGLAMAVGALDAYFCDKYTDCLTSVLRSFSRGEWQGRLPAAYAKQALPAGQVLDSSRTRRPAWGIRMAARDVMEKDNLLSISRLEKLFNPILPAGAKLWNDFAPAMLRHGKKRLTGGRTLQQVLAIQDNAQRARAIKHAAAVVRTRIGTIIQIRHDWIHNCGRPKTAIVMYSNGQVTERLAHVRVFVETFDDHIETHRIV